jgi:hypothetical protein
MEMQQQQSSNSNLKCGKRMKKQKKTKKNQFLHLAGLT